MPGLAIIAVATYFPQWRTIKQTMHCDPMHIWNIYSMWLFLYGWRWPYAFLITSVVHSALPSNSRNGLSNLEDCWTMCVYVWSASSCSAIHTWAALHTQCTHEHARRSNARVQINWYEMNCFEDAGSRESVYCILEHNNSGSRHSASATSHKPHTHTYVLCVHRTKSRLSSDRLCIINVNCEWGRTSTVHLRD